MFTAEQANYLHAKLRQLEEDVKDKIGVNIHFGIYMSSKSVSAGLSVNDAIKIMAHALGITEEDVASKPKPHYLSIRRFVMASVLREQYKTLTLNSMGRLFNRDHTSIIHMLTRSTELVNINDEEYLELYAIAKNSLENKSFENNATDNE